jgi:hypothetical protein
MELFLNILWAVISVVALSVWRYHWKRQEGDAAPAWQQWPAFLCVLVFIFFAVSLSDDLHAAAILADDCTLGRHHSLGWNRGSPSHNDSGPVHGFVPLGTFAASPTPLEPGARIIPAESATVLARYLRTNFFRGPPVYAV